MIKKVIIVFLLIILSLNFIHADEQTVIQCGGDNQLVIGCIGDVQNMPSVPIPRFNVSNVYQSNPPSSSGGGGPVLQSILGNINQTNLGSTINNLNKPDKNILIKAVIWIIAFIILIIATIVTDILYKKKIINRAVQILILLFFAVISDVGIWIYNKLFFPGNEFLVTSISLSIGLILLFLVILLADLLKKNKKITEMFMIMMVISSGILIFVLYTLIQEVILKTNNHLSLWLILGSATLILLFISYMVDFSLRKI